MMVILLCFMVGLFWLGYRMLPNTLLLEALSVFIVLPFVLKAAIKVMEAIL